MKALITSILLLLSTIVSGQPFNQYMLQYITSQTGQVGTNAIAFIVIDFNDGSLFESYAWGYYYHTDTNPTIKEILADLASIDPNLEVQFRLPIETSSTLKSVKYNSHNRAIPTTPLEEGTWTNWMGTASDNMVFTGSANHLVTPGSWYGFRFSIGELTQQPTNINSALNPNYFNAIDFVWEVGTGDSFAYLAIDGVLINPAPVWKVRFDDPGWGTSPSFLLAILVNNNVLTKTTTGVFDNGTYKYISPIGSFLFHIDNMAIRTGTNYTDQQPGHLGTEVPPGGFIGITAYDLSRIYFMQPAPYSYMSVEDYTLNISVYPNPTTDFVNIEGVEVDKVIIYDLSGRLVDTQFSNKLDLTNFNSGIYLIDVYSGYLKSSQKIIKQ